MASALVLAASFGFAVFGAELSEGDGYYSPYNYASGVTFTITNYTGTAQSNFPVYLTISEKLIPGFHYADVRGGMDNVVFFDSRGKVLDYELEDGAWNTSGETRMWLSVPGFRNGEKIQMCWNLRDGCTQPAPGDPLRVWSDYVGVWHMDEEINDTAAKEQRPPSSDATGNGRDLEPRVGPEGVYYTMTSADGVFGRSRTNDTSARNKRQGSYFEMANSADLALNGVFTMSFWIKFDAYANYPQLMTRRNGSSGQTGFQVDMSNSDRTKLIARGTTQTGSYQQVVDKPFKEMGFVHLAFVYNGPKVSIYSDGVLRVDEMTIGAASDNGVPITIGNMGGGTDQSVWGEYDEIRLYKGVKSADWIAAEHAIATNKNLWVYGAVTNDANAVLKNDWTREPSAVRTTWDADDPTDRPTLEDFDAGAPAHGTVTITFYSKTTGESLGNIVPQAPGEYRAIFTVEESRDDGAWWGALARTIDFRIVSNKGTPELGINVDRVLLMNDDYTTEGAEVEWQSYDDVDGESGLPYWRHVDEYGRDASTAYDYYWSISDYFNFGGGSRHQYLMITGNNVTNRLWDLRGVRVGNTFNNTEGGYSEKDAEGLKPWQNYLPWSPDSQRVRLYDGDTVGPYHRYVGQVLMQNAMNAWVASSLYTNGIGTVYFDAVNGWANNVRDADGNANYRLIVEIATNCVNSTLPPTDELISSNPGDLDAHDPFLYADWKRVDVRVLRFNGEACTDLGMSDSAVLDVEDGGSYTNFYRIIAPVGVRGKVRFRIRRTAIDPDQSLSPDGSAYLLIDNIICSTAPDSVQLSPYGHYDAGLTGHEVQGWGGAFTPAFPAAGDVVTGRARATMANGGPVKAGTITSATMHYRWHYIDQKTTGELLADLDPATLETRRPLALPPFEGDIEFWFDLNQVGSYYEYVDYSGTGLGLADSGYCEAISSVTNRAPTYVAATKTGDWFVRLREGKSNYAKMALLVKTSEDAAPQEVGLWVSGNRLWRGYYRMKEVLEEGFWWRIEARDRQEDGAKAWNYSTNRWYVADWTQTPPAFPATGRMSDGTEESWSRMPCDCETGYLMFQLDETTRGLTVIHADYQNFNDWNAPNEFFSGSSTEPTEKQGTSAEVKTFDLSFRKWADERTTDEDWQLNFTGKYIGNDYPGYQTFSSWENHFRGWNLAKGMWVYGKYRERNSYIAYQAAGSGEGYAEFTKTGGIGNNWPRGIGSVSLKARLAQAITPDKASYFDGGQRLTNYTFMVRGCFDRQKNEGFAGNAALSLFAYYRRSRGTYEARWEQINGKQTKNPNYPTEFLGPQADGQRLVISRWDAVGDTYKETELYAVTNSTQNGWKFAMPLTPYESVTATNNLMPFCISVYEQGGATVVAAAVRVNTTTTPSGVTWNRDMSEMRDSWYFAVAVDKSSKRLKNGTYGVLTSNSEGMMLSPQFRDAPTHPSDVTLAQMAQITGGTGCFPSQEKEDPPKSIDSVTGFEPCFDDLADDWWIVNPGRNAAYFGSSELEPYGFSYVAEPQTVDIYTAPLGGSAWTQRASVPVTDFGRPYNEVRIGTDLYVTEDCQMRVRTGGSLDDYRRDVVMSDIVVTQWRGCDGWSTSGSDWDFYEDVPAPSSHNNYGYTNIVFTSGWVTNKAVRLSAKRTPAGYAASVRSPLFDGLPQRTDEGRIIRGVGLGSIRFKYREPTRNIRLLVQIATNYSETTGVSLKEMSRTVRTGEGYWTTVETLTYDMLTDAAHWNGETGAWETRFGLHGMQGLMRVVIDDALTQEVQNETDPSRFGEIDILEVMCKDEPALDKGCWWGWNLKTVGDANDSTRRMYLADYSPLLKYVGQSMALNNSTTDGTDPDQDASEFRKHLPFVQSPSFTNALIGQISFKARKYDMSERAPNAKVVVYGATKLPNELEYDKDWTKLDEFDITNMVYETFTCKTQNEHYYALRLAVLIDGTEEAPEEAEGVRNPQRVLLDEVAISEAVSAAMAFRNVGAFRGDWLMNTDYVPGVTTKEQQPLCDENWGIQAEVFATMLEDEICTESNAVVTLYWYEGTTPWGYKNWKNRATGHAKLASVPGSNFVFRASYDLARDAVMPAQPKAPTVVQYMLEVEYWTVHADKGKRVILPATNWLDTTSWTTPDWYAPLDYNADPQYGAGKTFAGFTILDKIAPGWAWVNEVNILGETTESGSNTEKTFQYAEVCAPCEADLSGWKLRFLEAAISSDLVKTNVVATFGAGSLSGTKTLNMASNMVFRCVGVKESAKMKRSDGSLDAPWTFSTVTDIFKQDTINNYYYIYNTEMPFGVQLVRPNGIIEHSVVVMGTNRWSRVGRSAYDPTNIVAKLNRNVPGSKFFYAAEDCCGTFRSGSVVDSQGESAEHWANDWWCSPGFVNTNGTGQAQQIKQHPVPAGDTLLVYARVDRSGGPIRQYVGGRGSTATNDFEIIFLRKGSETGTNIFYEVDAWYEVAGVTTNGSPAWVPGPLPKRELTFTVGVQASNTIEVVASAMDDRTLAHDYGLTEDNPYRSAVLEWLHGGATLHRPFANNGTIALADVVNMAGSVVTNMTLTTMYWLDMDPTMEGQILKAGMTGRPQAWPIEEGVTNVRLSAFMMITNRLDGAISPYVLRGLEPGSETSRYNPTTSPVWTSETFKVTGILANGLTSRYNKNHWIPLRWFVFDADSFYQPGNTEGKEPFTADIEIVDPHSESSPGAQAGWYDWVQEHGYTPVFNAWHIDERNRPSAPELLRPNSYYE